IYTNASFWNAHLNSNFGSYPLWIANYGVSSPKIPNGWTAWNFWQYSQSGACSGVNGDVDTNYFNGSINELNVFLKSNQSGQPNNNPDSTSESSENADSTINTSTDSSGGGYTYIVKSGDTLDGIAASFGVSASALQQANRIQ